MKNPFQDQHWSIVKHYSLVKITMSLIIMWVVVFVVLLIKVIKVCLGRGFARVQDQVLLFVLL